MQLLLDGKNECSSYKMWDGSDIIFSYIYRNIPSNIFYTQLENLAQVYRVNIYIYIYICYLHMWDRGRGTRSHHRVCWPYHASKHMAHSIQRRMLGNVTEIRYSSLLQQYKPRFSCTCQTLPVWKHNGRMLLLLCIRTASALLTRRSCLRCEGGVTHRKKVIKQVFFAIFQYRDNTVYRDKSFSNYLKLILPHAY